MENTRLQNVNCLKYTTVALEFEKEVYTSFVIRIEKQREQELSVGFAAILL